MPMPFRAASANELNLKGMDGIAIPLLSISVVIWLRVNSGRIVHQPCSVAIVGSLARYCRCIFEKRGALKFVKPDALKPLWASKPKAVRPIVIRDHAILMRGAGLAQHHRDWDRGSDAIPQMHVVEWIAQPRPNNREAKARDDNQGNSFHSHLVYLSAAPLPSMDRWPSTLVQIIPHQPRNFPHVSGRCLCLGGIAAMLSGVAVAPRCAGIRAAVHPAAALSLHCRGLALRSRTGPG